MKYFILIALALVGCSNKNNQKEMDKFKYQTGCLTAFNYIYKNEMKPTNDQIDHAIQFCNDEAEKYANTINQD